MTICITQHDHVCTEEREGQIIQVDQQDDQKVRLWETFPKPKELTQTQTFIKSSIKLNCSRTKIWGPKNRRGIQITTVLDLVHKKKKKKKKFH